jgi:phosphonoacetaldehyde hydrolase
MFHRSLIAASKRANVICGKRFNSNVSAGVNVCGKRFNSDVLEAGIFDWSGTLADEGSVAPAFVFYEVFREASVPITMEDARAPMGARKDVHLRQLLTLPHVGKLWNDVYHRTWTSMDFELLLHNYKVKQKSCLTSTTSSSTFTQLIPGSVESINILRKDFGMKIGLTTGFYKEISDIFVDSAKKQGLDLDACVAGDEVSNPRPAADGMFENFNRLKISKSRAHCVVKVDDTLGGIGEGINAGAWTIGVYETSSYMDVNSREELQSLGDEEFYARSKRSMKKLASAKPDFLVPNISFVPHVALLINVRLKNNQVPGSRSSQLIM